MMMSDSFLSNAGSVFFAFWSLVVGAVGVAAFGRDLFPTRQKVVSDSAHNSPSRAR